MFKCDRCGLCCRNLKNSEMYRMLDRGDGVCKYLRGNLCSIYEERPLLCRVDDAYELYFKEQYTREEYYKINYEGCERIQSHNICNNLKEE